MINRKNLDRTNRMYRIERIAVRNILFILSNLQRGAEAWTGSTGLAGLAGWWAGIYPDHPVNPV